MRYFIPFAVFVRQPLTQVVDGAAGGGAAGSQGSQGSQGQQGGAQGSPASGGSAISPVSLADDTPITHDGKTMSWKEYREANFAPKSELENVRKLTREEITKNLTQLAKSLQKQPGQQQPQGQQQRQDPFAAYRDLPIVSGKELTQLAEAGFGQLAGAIQQLQKQNQELATNLKKVQGGMGTIAKERSGQERQARVAEAITSLGEGHDVKDPFLQDVAQDLIDAWEFNTPKEFHDMLGQRVAAMEKFVRSRDKAKLEASKKRIWTRPGGSATPNGQGRVNQKLAPKQIADALFGVPANT